MTKENLKNDLKDATRQLLKIARSHSWNLISDECLYITSEIRNSVAENFFELRRNRKKENEKKKPRDLNQIVAELNDAYENLYDVNLYIYKSSSKLTVVEIQYYLKASLDKDYYEKVKDSRPMLHCKVAIPPYLKDNKTKFDINWELGGFRHNWKLFWWRQKIKKIIE